jgi:uncharacterized FlaG/YvyC family protein
MTQIGRFTPFQQVTALYVAPVAPAAEPQPQAAQATKGVEVSGTIVGDVPPAPTPEARELVAKAAEVVEQMRKNNRELHFTHDEDTNRVVIQVRDLDGKVLKTIPPSEAMNIMAGGEL